MFDQVTHPLELNKEHIKNEIEILNSHLSANKQDNDKNQKLIEYINSFSEMITKDISMPEKRQFLDFFIEKVTLYDDDHMEIVWKGAGLNDSGQVDFSEQRARREVY
ncbi:hypothetical protein [Bacillus atrophaeus]|nr:hypothetical protein [Bacillus atrophaeus]MCY8824398.1 hypothetical protein [Bacillus atrophaeus]MCY8842551.1 hypothetical protein [Bacillus atrophaeus]MEC0804761.1 hypothetical protein [Bacillus atrophaeus]MEC0852678.1 hypothetical protein [Bacillus atrophaeus]MEC0859590.1 hypothetical protein [Bacillus atrophaeus]